MSQSQHKQRYISSHQDATYDHVLKYTGVFGGVQGLKMLVSVVRNKLTARFLRGVGMGLNAIYMNIAEIINSATNLGLSFSAVRHISEIFEEGTEEEMERYVMVVRTWCFWTAMLAAVVCMVSAPLFSYLFFEHSFSHTPLIMLLSFMLFAMPIEAGECAILKGMRHLKLIATIETIAVVATLLTTIPLYMIWGIGSIVISLVLTNVIIALIHLYFSVKVVPYHIQPFSRKVFHEGFGLVKLGVPYVLAALAGALTTYFIFDCLKGHEQIGLYKAGYGLMLTIGNIAFVAVEADYFPRLSSVNNDVQRLNKTINQQIDVCLMLATPVLIGFILALPVVVPALLTSEFLAIIPMCTFATFYMFLRCVAVPLEYTALAKGDSIMYLIMEVFYDAICVLMMRYMFSQYGLTGAGIALSASVTINIMLVYLVYNWRYGCQLSLRTVRLAVFQLVCLSAVVFVSFSSNLWLKYALGTLVFLISSWRSFAMLSTESGVVRKVLDRLRHNNNHHCC